MSGISHPRFVGREKELEDLFKALADPDVRAIMVVGPEGMGKSTLIKEFLELARTDERRACGGVVYDVTASDTVDAILEWILLDIYSASGMRERSTDRSPQTRKQVEALLDVFKLKDLVKSLSQDPSGPVRARFCEAMEVVAKKIPEDGCALYVIDPVKELDEKCGDQWIAVMDALPRGIKLVFGQRPHDTLAGDNKFRGHKHVALVPRVPLAKLDEKAARTLSDRVCVEHGLDAEKVWNEVSRYDGHPYAIEGALDLVTEWVRNNEPWELPDDPTPTEVARTQWTQVVKKGEHAMAAFRALALLQTYADEKALCAASGLTYDQVQTVLEHDGYLRGLTRHSSGKRRVYHDILSAVVLSNTPDTVARPFHERAVVHFTERVEACTGRVPDGLAAERLPHHLLKLAGVEPAFLAFVNVCFPLLVRAGRYEYLISESERWLDTDKGQEHISVLLGNLGSLYATRGELARAEESYLRALAIDGELGRKQGMANHYGNLGNLYATRGELARAEESYLKSLKINEDLGSNLGMASVYGALGNLYATRGELARAEESYLKALAIDGEFGRKQGMANQYGNLGNLYATRGEFAGAEESYRRSLAIIEELGDKEGMASAYGNLGLLYMARGEQDRAEESYLRSLAISEELGLKEGMAGVYGNLGLLYVRRGDLNRAEESYVRSIAIDAEIGHQEGMANQYGNLGVLYMARGEQDRAEESYLRSLAISEELGLKQGIASVSGNLGNLYATRGELERAEASYMRSLAINEELGRREGMASNHSNLGVLYEMRGDLARARELWTTARDLYTEIGIPNRVEELLGWLDESEGGRSDGS